jgi:hypothetical protein
MGRQKDKRQDQRNIEAKNAAIHGPYWLRAHRDWRFWAVVWLMLLAMAVYVFTNDLAWRSGHLRMAVMGVTGN